MDSSNLNLEEEIPEKITNIRNACLSHAADLIRASKRILTDEKLPNISYHLAVLALEEIGKSSLIMMGYFSSIKNESAWSPEKFYDDHIKKLFWAFWGPSIGREKITKKQIESFQGLSHRVHNTRLQALYVDFNSEGVSVPSESITESEAQNLINTAEARLEIERLLKYGEIDEDNLKHIKWFLAATSDQEKRDLIFNDRSMEKLADLGSTNKWIAWLNDEFDKAEEIARQAANQELQRKPSDDIENFEDKWRIKIRLFTNSHSIRPKPLNKWNDLSSWIRLYPVGEKKNQLIAEFTLPKNISVHNLWWAAWAAARRFVVALNIGTFGCFWWYIPEQISRFYEKIDDLENKDMDVRLERNPILKLDWKRGVLSERDLQNTALCVGLLPGENESEFGQSMGSYITALAFLNKNDIHFQFESNSYESFYKSLKHGMRHFGEWDGIQYFPDRLRELLESFRIDQYEIDRYKNISNVFETSPPTFNGIKITLSEVGEMKNICDLYFMTKFREIAQAEKNRNQTNT